LYPSVHYVRSGHSVHPVHNSINGDKYMSIVQFSADMIRLLYVLLLLLHVGTHAGVTSPKGYVNFWYFFTSNLKHTF